MNAARSVGAWTGVRRIGAWLASATLLGGCAALQVEVDVYKGPLLNEPEIQQRQYAYLAISARPLIVQMKNQAHTALAACMAKSCAQQQQLTNLVKFLFDVDGYYDGSTPELKAVQRQPTRGKGLVDLTQALSTAYQSKDETIIKDSLAALNEALIAFASNILFVVNHETLYRDTANLGISDHRPVLQSLANSILLHANDINRQAQRDDRMRTHAVDERKAVAAAFHVAPSAAFDEIRRTLSQVTTPDATQTAGPGDASATARTDLANKVQLLASATDELATHQSDSQSLWASYRTLVAEARAGVLEPPPSRTELMAANQDRRALAALYPAVAVAEADLAGEAALAPLRQWLDRERTASIVPERKTRLALVVAYIEKDKARLLADVAGAAQKSDLLAQFRSRLDQDATLAQQRVTDLQARINALKKEVQVLEARVAQDQRVSDSAARRTATQRVEVGRAEAAGRVLDHVRAAVLQQADAAGVADRAAFHALLKAHVAQLQPDSRGLPTREDIDIAKRVLSAQPVPSESSTQCAAASQDEESGSCVSDNQMDVVDGLIASLRAQRVQALARGDAQAAEQLQQAIDTAYEQRAAMIYLRPASDYLRSVHTASDLQDAQEGQYRNMLNDWMKYMDVFTSDKSKRQEELESRRLELDKLYWQNVNRVTVGGGGFTNFVLAKDDTGNWYVKAYSSDPATIFESATNLALFNAGSRLNVNLLQRYEIQKRLDSGKATDDEKDTLKEQLSNLNSQDGRPLLAVRARHLARYETRTRETAQGLLKSMLGMPAQVTATIDVNAAEKAQSCSLDTLKTALTPLDGTHLAPSRDALDQLLRQLGVADDKLVEKIEQATLAALTASVQYAERVFKVINESQADVCVAAWRTKVAQQARKDLRAQVRGVAAQRLSAVDRYEEALINLTDVAMQK